MAAHAQRAMQGNTNHRRFLPARNVRRNRPRPLGPSRAIAKPGSKAIRSRHARYVRSESTRLPLPAHASRVPPAQFPASPAAPRVSYAPPARPRPPTAANAKSAPTVHSPAQQTSVSATNVRAGSTPASRPTNAACRARRVSTPLRRGPPRAPRAARVPTATTVPTARPRQAAASAGHVSRAPPTASTSAA